MNPDPKPSQPHTYTETVELKTVIKNKSSQNLLDFLSRRFHYLTPAQWRERILDGRVTVNERAASEGQPLRAGDVVRYWTTPWAEPEVRRDYRVVYEDSTIFVVSKPAPLPVHAIGAYFKNTLLSILRKDIPEAEAYQLVHRLDAETSGLLLLVKDKSLVYPFQKMWSRDGLSPSPLAGEGGVRGAGDFVRKSYRAIVFGRFASTQKRFEGPIGSDRESAVRMKLKVDREKGKPSVTEFELLETKGNFSLVEARILTGRTHQIRVHLEHLGHPIVGDKLYSGSDETFLHFYEKGWDEWLQQKVILPRMALHACRLEFTHVKTGEKMVFEDPMTEDLMAFWNGLSAV